MSRSDGSASAAASRGRPDRRPVRRHHAEPHPAGGPAADHLGEVVCIHIVGKLSEARVELLNLRGRGAFLWTEDLRCAARAELDVE